MSNLPPTDAMSKLRADLRHFEENGDFGQSPTVLEIKSHLLRRIAELEAALCRTKELEAAAFPVAPRTPDPQ